MKYLLNNLSVRALITSLLTLFASMLVLGAALGVLALRSNNESTALARAVSSRVILVNDAYKDTTRARSALTRAYTTVRESNDADKAAVAAGAVAAAGKSLEKALNQLEAFAAGPVLTTEEEALRKPLVVLGRLYLDAIGAAARALAANDPAAYVTINTKDITASGSAFSAALEKFQAAATDSANEISPPATAT
jgi:methyl-accepting chemotaxis protein